MTAHIMVEGEQPIWVPPGNYEVFFSHWETRWRYGWGPKAYLWFLVTEGEYQGAPLCRHYNVKRFTTEPGPEGLFTVGRNSDYFREYVDCHGAPDDPSLIPPPSRYLDGIVLGEVATVTKDRSGNALPESTRYSRIRKLRPIAKREHNDE